jgi:tRNA (guanine37-N1)-methyltransferase
MLQIDVVSIFPGLFQPFSSESFVGIAQQRSRLRLAAHDLRDWTHDRHRTVDDSPYGGGPGMVMKPEPLVEAVEALRGPEGPEGPARVILMSPQGSRMDQAMLERLSQERRLLLLCGRYEGVDQRVIDLVVDEEISIGDFVLSGGEVPAMVLIEGLVRLLPDVLGNPESAIHESFRGDLLEGPQYTRPPAFRDLEVPAVLRSGDHAAIARWREAQSRRLTRLRRPDLLGPDKGENER